MFRGPTFWALESWFLVESFVTAGKVVLSLCFYFFFKKRCPLHSVLVRVKCDNTYKDVKHFNNAGHK